MEEEKMLSGIAKTYRLSIHIKACSQYNDVNPKLPIEKAIETEILLV